MKISQTKDIRSTNRLTIIKHILSKKQISHARISKETGLNKVTVSTIVKEWTSLKLVKEATMDDSSGGRPPIILTLTAKAGYYITVDIGARRISLIFMDLNNDTINRRSLFIGKKTFSYVYQRIYVTIDKVIREIPSCLYEPIGISLTTRGIIGLDGVIRFIPKPQWHNIDIKFLLEQRYNVPVYINNDGNLAAFMESRLHPQYEELTVLCISDVISCGMVSDGQLIRDYLGLASAVEHHTINIQEAKQCSRSKYGCWEQYCSNQCLLDEINLHLEKPLEDIDEFIELVKKQYPFALAVLDTYIRNLAIGLSSIIFSIDCEMITLNSHLAQSLPYPLSEIMKDIVLPITHTQEILVSSLGNEGPTLGASLKAIEKSFEALSAHG